MGKGRGYWGREGCREGGQELAHGPRMGVNRGVVGKGGRYVGC